MTVRSRAATVALCGGAVLAALPAGAADAAGDTYKGCDPGNVCLYKNPADGPVYETAGTIPDGKWGWMIVNNGHRSPGLDHVRFDYKHTVGGSWKSKCLHYYPGSGFKFDVSDGATPIEIKNMSWGGEC